MSLPKNLLYKSRVESAAAKSSRVNIAPNNGTGPYSLGDTIIINIPTRQSLVLSCAESYLRFTLGAITAGATATAIRAESGGLHSIIQRIRIWSGGNLLQDIDNYGLLSKMLFDIQAPSDACYGKFNILAGCRSDLAVTIPASTAPATATGGDLAAAAAATTAAINLALSTISNTKLSAQQINSGILLKKNNNANTLAAGEFTYSPTDGLNAQVFCLNLNCLLGTLSSQNYFPLFAATSSPIRMEITLVDSIYKFLNVSGPVTGAGITATASFASGAITNVEYIANFIELGDSAMSVVASSLNGAPLQMVVPDYRNYQFSYALPSTSGGNPVTTQISMAIPAKFSSLKSLFVTFRDKGTGSPGFFPCSSVTNGLLDYQFRIGASIFPPKAPATYPEMFAEVVKAIGSMSDLTYQPSIDKFTYTMATSVANNVEQEANGASNVNSGSFYVGIDLENYINSDKSQTFAGWNSNVDDIFFIGNFNNMVASVVNVRLDCFANFDSAIIFENGTAYVRY